MSNPDSKWYILQAYAGYESKVERIINEQAKVKKLETLVDEIFIPSEEVTTRKKGKKQTTKVTYFPGYILIKMHLTPDLWHLLKEIPKVSGFVGGTQKDPMPISEKELEEIRSQIRSGIRQAEIDSTYQVGQSVTVIEGPFAEFNGTVETVDVERNKLTVLVSIFGRATPLELEFDKVKPNE